MLVEALLTLILLLMGAMGFMVKRYFERAERHFRDIHDLMGFVNVHEFSINRLWQQVYGQPYPYSIKRNDQDGD